MSSIVYLSMVLLSLHAANSYILLTANLDDFHAIAKQIADSPVGGQINHIFRRASKLFNRELNDLSRPRKRADSSNDNDNSYEVWKPGHRDEVRGSRTDNDNLSERDEEYLQKTRAEAGGDRRKGNDDLEALGKNASYYLQSIKKIFENV